MRRTTIFSHSGRHWKAEGWYTPPSHAEIRGHVTEPEFAVEKLWVQHKAEWHEQETDWFAESKLLGLERLAAQAVLEASRDAE